MSEYDEFSGLNRPPVVKDGLLIFVSVPEGKDVLMRAENNGWSAVHCPTCFGVIHKYNPATEFYICGRNHYWREVELQ